MNILFYNTYPIHKNNGGVQRVTSVLASQFEKLNYRVFYLTSEVGQFEIIEGISQYYLPEEGIGNSINNINFAKKILVECNIDVIINQAGIYNSATSFLKSIKDNKIKILTVHHNCISCLQHNYRNIILGNEGFLKKIMTVLDYSTVWSLLKIYNKFKYRGYFNNTLEISDKLVLLSPKFISELGVFLTKWDSEKVIAVSNPASFEPQPQYLSNKENRILYIGRIEYAQKQVDVLIDIWTDIFAKNPDWHLDIVGDGSKLKEVRELAIKKGLKNIHFYGHQNPVEYLKRAKILVLTSTFEGFGMVLVEAQAYGVVPVSFNCFSAIRDIISEGSGLIIPASDKVDFIEKLNSLMKDNNYREVLAANALLNSKKFSASLIASKWVDIFKGELI
jgi:glycosyltransferase involved in cell wall biosynthesis